MKFLDFLDFSPGQPGDRAKCDFWTLFDSSRVGVEKISLRHSEELPAAPDSIDGSFNSDPTLSLR